MKQSAVEWLSQELYEKFEMKGDGALFNDLLNQAKEMEKQQQDEFAIGFAEWINFNFKLAFSNKAFKELLEIYKKEKGL